MNFKNKLQKLFLLLLLIIPFNVFAYSEYIIPGGGNIGIEVNSDGIMVVGFYEVNGKNIGKNSGFQVGDRIIKVSGNDVTSIDNMVKLINTTMQNNIVNFTVLRANKEVDINLEVFKDKSGVYKTGLYVKDSITGIGTLTYIDPETKIFGALGHEIIEANSNIKMEIKDGKIFKARITGITKSTEKTTGEKNAKFDDDITYGTIKENTTSGIYGSYSEVLDKSNLKKVIRVQMFALPILPVLLIFNILILNSSILTVLEDNNIEEFSINILKINKTGKTKNILFEITDKELLNKTNGVIKGMSGSPIIQGDKIVGAVTHAIVGDNAKGYGICITTRLKEGED